MTVPELIDACVQRRYAAWAVMNGSAKPSAEAVESLRKDVRALARQIRFSYLGRPGDCQPEPVLPIVLFAGDDFDELRQQLDGLEWLLKKLAA